MKRKIHKALSMLLTAALVLNMGLIPAFAEEATPTGISGVCTHHTAHKVNGGEADREDPLGGTEDCGYQQGTPCNHEHTDGCYTKMLTCTITVGGTPEIATDSEAVLDSGEPAEKAEPHTHGEDCFTKTENCNHEHDETCGYIPDSPCTYDPESCTECDTDKQPEQVCTCEPVDSGNLPQGELVHGENCPLYTTPALSEAVKALIAMVDALPNADTITDKNKEDTMSTCDAATMAYEELSDEDKAVFEATKQYKKLMALHSVLYPFVLMANEATHNISTGNLTLTGDCGSNCTHTVTGSTSQYKIIVSGGTHNITLNNVSINVSGAGEGTCAFEITSSSTVNLTLTGTNTLKSGRDRAGLEVTEGNTLTVTSASTGSLGATGGQYGAGIGGGDSGSGGIIAIGGGTVTATGGIYAAGIGGGTGGSGGNIAIDGDNTKVEATGGDGGAGIGGGEGGAGGDITISGGTVTTTGGTYAAGIGGGDGGGGGGDGGDGGDITISGDNTKVDATGGRNGAGIGGGSSGDGGDIAISDGTVTATGGRNAAGIGGGDGGSGGIIAISDGIVTATGGSNGAGIGGGDSGSGGIITINSGTVTATGGNTGAGIGGGSSGGGGAITIGGGTVTATGGDGGAGIGGGEGGAGGDITISGGMVSAMGNHSAAGIGGGDDGDGGTITISGGTVEATGGDYASGIGGGNYGDGGTITISGGTVEATGGKDIDDAMFGAGIGGIITISGGTVTAMGGTGIGGGGGGDGSFSTGASASTPGNGVIFAVPSIGDKTSSGNWNGVIFEGKSGALYGNVTLGGDLTIPAGHTLTIPSGKTLTVPDGVTLKNEGTLTNSGNITLSGNGTLEGTPPDGGTVTQASLTGTVSISGTLKYGQTLTATLSNSNNKGTLSYRWLRGNTELGTNASYTAVEADIGQTLTCEVKSTVQTGSVSGSTTGTIAKGDGPLAPGVTLSFSSGANQNKLMGTTDLMELSLDSGTIWAVCAANHDLTASLERITPSHGIQIRLKETATHLAGTSQTVGVTAGGAVTGVTAIGCTNGSNNDGVLKGVSAAMEYSLKSSGTWNNGTGGEITGLASGTYLVRTKAAYTALAGDTSEFTVSQYTPAPTYRINLSQSGTYTFAGATAGYGTQTPLTVTVQNTGNQVTGGLTVALSGANSGSFTLSKGNLNSIAANGTDSFTIVPNTGLAVGTYTATVTVSGRNNIFASFNVNFTVKSSTPSSGGGNGGGDSTTTPPTVVTKPTTPENPNPSTTVQTDVSSKTDRNGKATATVGDKSVTDAIRKAQDEAKKNGTEKNSISIVLNVKMDKNATSLEVTLSKATIDALIRAGVTEFTIKNALSSVTFDLATLKALTGGEVKLSIGKVDVKTLSAEAQQAIGNRSVFQYGVTVGGKAVTDFKGGRAGLQMPYTRSTTEQTGNLVGVYVDGSGKVTWLENSSYDPITGMMLASTSHFSVYGIGYKQSTPKFSDVGIHWAKNDIDFVVARGLLTGTSNTTFAPDQSMTRGMFVTSLGRLAGIDTKKYSNTKFVDVKADAYYSPYVAWANVNNIVNGTSDTTFSPDKAISRQEMAVMLVNYSKSIGYKLPSVHAEVTFTDAGSIASWAKDAVGQMQMASILMGKSGNKFDPTATATRAEVSAMLRRYVELVVSTETAEGWAMNDSGQWMYIQDGKRITGKKSIDGTAYTFDQYGVTTRNANM